MDRKASVLEHKKLGDIASLKTGPFGTQLSASEYVESGIPVINVKNIGYGEIRIGDLDFISQATRNRLSDHILHSGDIVFGRKGSVDRHAYISTAEDGWLQGSDCIRVRCLPGINSHYVSHYLRLESVKKQVNWAAVGSTMDSLNTDILREIHIALPSLETQNSIEGFLSQFDAAINLNNQINDNLQSTLQALYGYWFMQFNFPDVNGRPYRSSGGRMSYNEKLGRSIPEGWHVASIVNNPLTDVITPGVDLFKTKTYYATADVNGIDIGMGSFVDYETRESRANMQPGLHTVWFAKMKNSVKHLFLGHSMKRVIDDSILSTGFMGLQCKKVAFEYISAFIDGPYFERAKDQYANGATQQAVGNAELESVYLVIPDDETLARFHNLTRGLVESIGETIIENKKLVELRDWLLPMLMNGQVSVEAMQPNYRLPYD